MSFQIQLSTPANESLVDDPTDETPVDITVLTEQPEAVAETVAALEALEAEIATEAWRMNALESMIHALEAQSTIMQPFEVQMLTTACENFGIELPRHPYGYGLEGFTGPRGRAAVTVTLESFKEKFHALVQKILELFKKLLDKAIELFQTLTDQTNKHIEFYKQHLRTGGRRTRDASSKAAVDSAVAYLSVDGQFAPDKVIGNVLRTLQALGNGKFQHELVQYMDDVAGAIKPFLDDPSNWRRYVDGINKLNPPAPESFEVAEQGTALATYQSLPLVAGNRIQFKSVAGGNNHGARGAKERAQALASIGGVTIVGSAVHAPSSTALVHTQLDNLVPKVIEALETSRSLSASSRQTVNKLREKTKEVEALGNKELPPEAPSEISEISGHLLASLPKATSLVSGLIKNAAHMTIQLSNVYSHLTVNRFH